MKDDFTTWDLGALERLERALMDRLYGVLDIGVMPYASPDSRAIDSARLTALQRELDRRMDATLGRLSRAA